MIQSTDEQVTDERYLDCPITRECLLGMGFSFDRKHSNRLVFDLMPDLWIEEHFDSSRPKYNPHYYTSIFYVYGREDGKRLVHLYLVRQLMEYIALHKRKLEFMARAREEGQIEEDMYNRIGWIVERPEMRPDIKRV